ncbi:MAG: alpha-amylase [Christensenella sp.]
MSGNGTMMQYFEWYMPIGMLWKKIKAEAEALSNSGITALWIPPAYKGSGGVYDVGYGVYDLYDLGEFEQKGTVATKYGTKEELLSAIQVLHAHGMHVYADVVLDHMMGADGVEIVSAAEVNPKNRNEQTSGKQQISAWTHFRFPGRNRKYSDFEWHWYHFTGIDWDQMANESGVYKFEGKEWDKSVDDENGNYDYLMGADIDLEHFDVITELTQWGKWFIETTDIDGFRFDAVKHMKFSFYQNWLDSMRRDAKEELFSVGEYWNADIGALKHYIDATKGALSLFDVPLHFKFFEAAKSNGSFDMRTIFDGTLVQDNPTRAVTFVDNHDTQPGQALESWVTDWFKPLAYALILLRCGGYPCVFYGDYYGIEHSNISPKREWIDRLVAARRDLAYGEQNDYFDNPNIVGWTREGDDEHEGSGIAVVLTNGEGGSKRMYIGKKFAGARFYDCTHNRSDEITIDEDGTADFPVNGGSVSVWCVKK